MKSEISNLARNREEITCKTNSILDFLNSSAAGERKHIRNLGELGGLQVLLRNSKIVWSQSATESS